MEKYEEILGCISPHLVTDHRAGGIEEIEPSKELLIFFSYWANQESMSEVSLYFDVGMAGVHKTIGKFNSVINECLGSVCTPLNTSTFGYHMRHLTSGSNV